MSERFQAYTTAFWLPPGADRSRAMLKFGEELVRRFDGPTRDVFVLTIPGIWFISRLQALHEFMASLEVPEAQRKELDTDLKKEPHDVDVAPDPVAQLRHAALTALQGDESALERLITHHRTRDPQADEGLILTEVIRALRRDRS